MTNEILIVWSALHKSNNEEDLQKLKRKEKSVVLLKEKKKPPENQFSKKLWVGVVIIQCYTSTYIGYTLATFLISINKHN